MVFIIVSILVPIITFFALPRVLASLKPHRQKTRTSLLAIACGLFFISWYLPSPLIDGENTAFVTHFVGGGLFTGFVWLYSKQYLGLPHRPLIDTSVLFTLVSALGVLNELFELFLDVTGIHHMPLDDTSWDLFANTLGAFVFYIGFLLLSRSRHLRKNKRSTADLKRTH